MGVRRQDNVLHTPYAAPLCTSSRGQAPVESDGDLADGPLNTPGFLA
eukprot:CAMPEP_0180567642 /NCGR_PEP_ID=MMETSP1037_2-20121125/6712_1 /TAXON_ID=632150 /ORGANISM="Azadinium spinosum, Strain 3D9" /LENGTH=46 /DNA_ID= /DNA_START= /DNA_END= /DNA_ORIENTATION=